MTEDIISFSCNQVARRHQNEDFLQEIPVHQVKSLEWISCLRFVCLDPKTCSVTCILGLNTTNTPIFSDFLNPFICSYCTIGFYSIFNIFEYFFKNSCSSCSSDFSFDFRILTRASCLWILEVLSFWNVRKQTDLQDQRHQERQQILQNHGNRNLFNQKMDPSKHLQN